MLGYAAGGVLFAAFGQGAVALAPRGFGVGATGVAIANAFFRQQAFDEDEVGFAVLQAVGTNEAGLAKLGLVLEALREHEVAGEVLVTNRCDDLRHAPVLENAAVAAVHQGRQRRFDGERVFRKTAVGAMVFGARDEAGKQAFAAVGQQEGNLDRLAEEFLQFEIGVGRQTVENVAVVRRKGFFPRRPVRQHGARRNAAVFGEAQLEQPRTLTK